MYCLNLVVGPIKRRLALMVGPIERRLILMVGPIERRLTPMVGPIERRLTLMVGPIESSLDNLELLQMEVVEIPERCGYLLTPEVGLKLLSCPRN